MTEPRGSSSVSAPRSLADHAALALLAAGTGVVACLVRPDPGVGVVAAFGSCVLVYTAVERALEPKRQVLRSAALAAVAFLAVVLRKPLAQTLEPLYALTALSAVSLMVGVFELSRLLTDRRTERLQASPVNVDAARPPTQTTTVRRITLNDDGGAEISQSGLTVIYDGAPVPVASPAPSTTEMADTTSSA